MRCRNIKILQDSHPEDHRLHTNSALTAEDPPPSQLMECLSISVKMSSGWPLCCLLLLGCCCCTRFATAVCRRARTSESTLVILACAVAALSVIALGVSLGLALRNAGAAGTDGGLSSTNRGLSSGSTLVQLVRTGPCCVQWPSSQTRPSMKKRLMQTGRW